MERFEVVFKAAIQGMHQENVKAYGTNLADVMFPGLEALKPVFKATYNQGVKDEQEKLEGCVVVPVELSDEVADSLTSKLFDDFKDIFNSEHRDLSVTEREQLRLRWSRNKARTLQEDYKLLVEAARGGNE